MMKLAEKVAEHNHELRNEELQYKSVSARYCLQSGQNREKIKRNRELEQVGELRQIQTEQNADKEAMLHSHWYKHTAVAVHL